MPEKKNISLMLAISFLQGMVFYSSIATLYRQAAGITLFQMSLIESISLLASMALEVPWGMIGDRIGYRKTLIISCGVFFASKLVFWRAEGFGMFLMERLLLAVALAGLSGVDESMMYLSCKEGEFQKVMGRYAAAGTAGLLLSSTIYAFAIDSYRMAALMTAVVYGLALMLSLGLKEVKKQEESPCHPWKDFRDCIRQMLSTPGLLTLILGGACFGETVHQITVFLNQLQYNRCGWDDRMIGVAYTLSTMVGLCGAMSDRCTRRWGNRGVGLSVMLVSAVCCIALTLTANGMLSMLCMLTLCMTSALYGPLGASMENHFIHKDQRATALSVNTLVYNAMAMMIDLLIGGAAEIRLTYALALGSILCLAGAGLFATSIRG